MHVEAQVSWGTGSVQSHRVCVGVGLMGAQPGPGAWAQIQAPS